MIKRLFPIVLCGEFIKFSFIGVCNTLIHAGLFLFLTADGYTQLFSNTAAFLIATTFSCLANTIWSFRSSISFTIIYRFFVVSLLGLTITSGLSATADFMHLNRYFTICCLLCFLPIINFLSHKYWTYRSYPKITPSP